MKMDRLNTFASIYTELKNIVSTETVTGLHDRNSRQERPGNAPWHPLGSIGRTDETPDLPTTVWLRRSARVCPNKRSTMKRKLTATVTFALALGMLLAMGAGGAAATESSVTQVNYDDSTTIADASGGDADASGGDAIGFGLGGSGGDGGNAGNTLLSLLSDNSGGDGGDAGAGVGVGVGGDGGDADGGDGGTAFAYSTTDQQNLNV